MIMQVSRQSQNKIFFFFNGVIGEVCAVMAIRVLVSPLVKQKNKQKKTKKQEMFNIGEENVVMTMKLNGEIPVKIDPAYLLSQ